MWIHLICRHPDNICMSHVGTMCIGPRVRTSVQRNTLRLSSPSVFSTFSAPFFLLCSTIHHHSSSTHLSSFLSWMTGITPLQLNPSFFMYRQTDGQMGRWMAGTEERWIRRSTSALLWYRTPAPSCHHCRSKQIAFTLCHFTRLNSSLFPSYAIFLLFPLSFVLSHFMSLEFHFSFYLWHISNSGVTLTINLTIYIEHRSREKFVIKKCIDPVYYSVVCCECWSKVT